MPGLLEAMIAKEEDHILDLPPGQKRLLRPIRRHRLSYPRVRIGIFICGNHFCDCRTGNREGIVGRRRWLVERRNSYGVVPVSSKIDCF
jgi:hypothetical protein